MAQKKDVYPCPACGFLTFQGPPGSYEICPVCNWEDDAVQLRFPQLRVGANRSSLEEWQHEVLKSHPIEQQEQGEWHRAPGWRPWTLQDQVTVGRPPGTGLDYFNTLAETGEVDYYWLVPGSS